MSNLENISIKELNEKCHLNVWEQYDWEQILVKDIPKNIRTKIDKYVDDNMQIDGNLIDVLIKYEKYVDKRKLLLESYYNYNFDDKEVDEERRKIQEKHIEYLKSIEDQNLGYIKEDLSDNRSIICLHNVFKRKDFTTYKDMKNILNKISKKAMLQILWQCIDKPDMYIYESIIQDIVGEAIKKECKKNANSDKEVALKMGKIMKEGSYLYLHQDNGCIDTIKEEFISYARYIKIKEMCYDTILAMYTCLEENYYSSNQTVQKQRKEYEEVLKELGDIIKNQEVVINLKEYEFDSDYLRKIMQQFKGEKFYTTQEIEEIIGYMSKNIKKLDEEDKIFIKNYIQNNDRKIENAQELKLVLDNNIFTKSEILEMIQLYKINLEDIENLKNQDEQFELITDEQFLDEYYKTKEKLLKGKQILVENGQFETLLQIYEMTNLIGQNREKHINNLLSKMEAKDRKYFEQAGLITKKEIEKFYKKKNETEIKEFKEKLKTSKGIQELLEKGDINPIDIIVGTKNKKIDKKIFIDMYLTGKVDFNMIKEYAKKHRVNGIISEQDIISEIAERQGTQNYDEEIQLLELYRRCINKPEEEKIYGLYIDEALEEKGENVTSLEDKRKLYNAGIISIDSIIDENNEEQIDNVLNNPILKIKDIQELYNKNIINDENIEHVLLTNKATLTQKVALAFAGGYNKRAKFINVILEEIEKQDDDKHKKEEKKIVSETLVMIREMLIKNQEVEIEAIQDGHIIIHLPNVEDGKRIIVQLYEMDNNNIVKTKNGGQAYVIDDYEYIMRKDEIIKNQSIDKLEIGKLLKQKVVDKISSKNIIEIAGKKESNSIYSLEEMDKVKELGNKAKKEIQQD